MECKYVYNSSDYVKLCIQFPHTTLDNMATNEDEVNLNDPQEQIDPNPKPLEEESIEDLLSKIRNDYRKVKKSIKRSILVLNDETKGLMVRGFTVKVGDKISGNEKLINLSNFCKKLVTLDRLLDTSLEYIEWLLIHIEQLERVDKFIRENVRENLLGTDMKEIAYFKNKINNFSMKTAVAVPTVGWVVGGVGGVVCATATATAVSIHAGLISIVAILASIGIAGVAGCGVGIMATGSIAGLTVGTGVGIAIWFVRAYQIGKARKGKFEEFVEMESNLDKQEVSQKVSIVSDELRRIVRQVKDIARKDYNIEDNVREDDRQRDKAVEKYNEAYREMLDDPNIQELSEEKKMKIAKSAAEKACKTALENDLVYGHEACFERFLRERIEIPDGRNNPRRGSNGG